MYWDIFVLGEHTIRNYGAYRHHSNFRYYRYVSGQILLANYRLLFEY